MSLPKIVATGPMDETAEAILAPFGPMFISPQTAAEAYLPKLGQAVALLVRGEAQITADVIAAGPALKVIGRSGVGYNNVDVDAATARRIPLVYTPGAGARAVAEAAMAMMLAMCKRIVHWDRELKAGRWTSRHEITNRDLDDATLGIVGFGRIGQVLAELARPFRMHVLAADPFVAADHGAQLGVRMVKIDELFATADFISIHAAATPENVGLVNRELLKQVKPGAFLINLARGSLIESLDVVDEALADGRLAGAGLDVFEPEPPDVTHPIFKRPNCLTAPHSLGMTKGAMARIFKSMAEDVAAVLSGHRPKFVVNPQVLD